MFTRDDLQEWVVTALRANGGSGRVVQVCKYIWEHHEGDLREAGDLFYTWQYDVRWAAEKLRKQGVLVPVHNKRGTPWTLV